MIAIRLPEDIEQRLNELSEKTGRAKSFYVREALIEYLDDLEDIFLAEQRLSENNQRISLQEMRQRLDLDN